MTWETERKRGGGREGGRKKRGRGNEKRKRKSMEIREMGENERQKVRRKE